MKINCELLHFFGWPTVNRSHLPRHDGAANALQRVFRPGNPSPRQRNFGFGSSSCIDELSRISVVALSYCWASKSQRTTTRSPVYECENGTVYGYCLLGFVCRPIQLPSASWLYGGSLWHALAALMTSYSTQYLQKKIRFML